jgi:hypothetical protein
VVQSHPRVSGLAKQVQERVHLGLVLGIAGSLSFAATIFLSLPLVNFFFAFHKGFDMHP